LHIKKHLGFNGLIKQISQRFGQIEDHRSREGAYSIRDVMMSGLAMMFFQDPSMLQFQKRLTENFERNNLETLFGVANIPSETQMRDVIDACPPEKTEIIFSDIFRELQRGKQLESFRVLEDRYLIVLDGTEYFSSDKIHCPGCLYHKKSKGGLRYHHQIVQAALVQPGCRQVIPLSPEAVRNEDGHEKQDCEINAGKRLIKKIRRQHAKLNIIIGGDSLYSKQPFIRALEEVGMSYVLVAKPGDHPSMFEWVAEITKMNEIGRWEFAESEKRSHRYEWVNGLPLGADPKAPEVNFFQYHLMVNGKVTYYNSWVTDVPVGKENVIELTRIGRARWKIENETFNTLKNQGYHIEHNFGHGRQNLSYNFFLLNLLAFFCHQIFELTDPLYRAARAAIGSRREYWNQLRCTIRIWVFPSWESLLATVWNPKQHPPP